MPIIGFIMPIIGFMPIIGCIPIIGIPCIGIVFIIGIPWFELGIALFMRAILWARPGGASVRT